MSPGPENNSNVHLTQLTTHNYEQLYQLDVLGLVDTSDADQNIVYTEFKEQLQRSTQGWYQTELPWEPNHPTLHNNKNGSLVHLSNLLLKLQGDPALFKDYDGKINEQLAEGTVEEAPATTTLKECYIPHKQSMYVDDVIGGGDNKESAKTFKKNIVKIFNETGIKLHKWHSNVAELEKEEDVSQVETDETYAKQQLSKGDTKTSILGISWNKQDDQLDVKFPQLQTEATKRGVLQYLTSVYDPIGLISLTLVREKMTFREIYNLKIGWDTKLPDQLKHKWERWKQSLPTSVGVPKSIPEFKVYIQKIDLRAFGDASKDRVCAAVYSVVEQSTSRLSKQDLTIPRLELVACRMFFTLLDNAKKALTGYPIDKLVAWTDSSIVLHWIRKNGNYKQFGKDRADKICKKKEIALSYMNITENPADIRSRGMSVAKMG